MQHRLIGNKANEKAAQRRDKRGGITLKDNRLQTKSPISQLKKELDSKSSVISKSGQPIQLARSTTTRPKKTFSDKRKKRERKERR